MSPDDVMVVHVMGKTSTYYSVFYTIYGNKVIVTDVLYTASDIEARLRGV